MTIVLSKAEVATAAIVGMRRHIEALWANRKDQHGFDGEDGWTKHIEGACGECAVAKHLGRYWNFSCNTFKAGGDVGKLQVRTRSEPHWDLIVRPDDSGDDIFVLVTGKAPTFEIRGWMRGRDAKQSKWWTTPNSRPKQWFVPQAELHSIEELPEYEK